MRRRLSGRCHGVDNAATVAFLAAAREHNRGDATEVNTVMGRRFDCNSIDKACRQTSSKWGSLLSKMPSNSDGRRKCTRLSRHRGLAIHLQFRALGSFAGCCPRVHTPHGCIPAPPHVGSFSTRRIQVVRDLAGATAMLSFLSLSLSLSLDSIACTLSWCTPSCR